MQAHRGIRAVGFPWSRAHAKRAPAIILHQAGLSKSASGQIMHPFDPHTPIALIVAQYMLY